MNRATRRATTAVAVTAIVLRFERDDDDFVKRVHVLGIIPVYDRRWRWVQRLRARREARGRGE